MYREGLPQDPLYTIVRDFDHGNVESPKFTHPTAIPWKFRDCLCVNM